MVIIDEMPIGAIPIGDVERIKLEWMLEENGAEELLPILPVVMRGGALEADGRYLEAREFYRGALAGDPENEWLAAALARTDDMLN